MDGTLSDCSHRAHLLPNWNDFFADMHKDPVIEQVQDIFKSFAYRRSLSSSFCERIGLIIVTARPEDYRVQTESWLKNNKIFYDRVYMRKSGDYRKDPEIKKDILDQIIQDGYTPYLAIDRTFWKCGEILVYSH